MIGHLPVWRYLLIWAVWRRDLIWQSEKIKTGINVNCRKFSILFVCRCSQQVRAGYFYFAVGLLKVTKYVHVQNLPLLRQSRVSDILWIAGAGMAQLWERPPPTNVSWPVFESRTRRHMWVEFVVGSLRRSERFFSGYTGFPLPSKINISKFPFDPWMHGHFWRSSCYLLGAPWVKKLHYIFFWLSVNTSIF